MSLDTNIYDEFSDFGNKGILLLFLLFIVLPNVGIVLLGILLALALSLTGNAWWSFLVIFYAVIYLIIILLYKIN
jgi:hypothetical protein